MPGWLQTMLLAVGVLIGVAFLTVTSDQVPPNPRMLICAFPLLVVVASRVGDKGYRRLIAWSTTAPVVMSALTFYASALRPWRCREVRFGGDLGPQRGQTIHRSQRVNRTVRTWAA